MINRRRETCLASHGPDPAPRALLSVVRLNYAVLVKPQRLSTALAIVFLATAFAWCQSSGPVPFDPQIARGKVVDQLATIDDPQQSYALYLPSKYSPDHRWPVLYVFDPFARGKTAVEVYQSAAEKYGYIVVGSNNSKNGPVAEQLEAARILWNDTHRRFAIDKDRVYTSGLSGGARVATAFAMYCSTCAVAGVIAHGAGYPVMQDKKPANDRFLFYVAIGDEDFNFPEIVALRRKKESTGAPCKVKVYPGPHQWAPPEIADDALAWLEVKAMQSGTEKTDPAFVQKQFEATKAEAAQAAQRGDALAQYYALRELASDFKGLENVAEFEGQLAQLKDSKAWKTATHNEQREIDDQKSLTATAASELAQLRTAEPDAQTGLARHIGAVLADLRRQVHSNGRERTVSARAFFQLWIQAIESGQEEFRNGRMQQAAAYFELASAADPDQAWTVVLLAEAQVRAGNKKAAIKALEEASHRGLRHPEALAQDPELQPLISDPAFQKIVQSPPAK
ncbi:MAG TPA: tetratricopeptide repeat protein [Candidatus Angelobacter sp.]|nr:tetratricopeptide repeat protein [Candidatus Angelobacter sp.]